MSKHDIGDSRTDPDKYRINDEIDVEEVRLVDDRGENQGKVSLRRALAMADEAGLDLVEVSPTADPPVCKIVDYSKFRYIRQKKRQEQRRKHKTIEMKEIKLRPHIDVRDYEIKTRHIKRFLEDGHRVKVSLRFRGREFAHQEIGLELLQRVQDQFSEITRVEHSPSMEGRQLVMILAPR